MKKTTSRKPTKALLKLAVKHVEAETKIFTREYTMFVHVLPYDEKKGEEEMEMCQKVKNVFFDTKARPEQIMRVLTFVIADIARCSNLVEDLQRYEEIIRNRSDISVG